MHYRVWGIPPRLTRQPSGLDSDRIREEPYKATWTDSTTDIAATSTTITVTDSSKDYHVRVRASNAADDSGWAESQLSRAIPPPAAPTGVTMARRHGPTGHMAMDVSWTAAAGAVAYKVRCGYIYYTTMPA